MKIIYTSLLVLFLMSSSAFGLAAPRAFDPAECHAIQRITILIRLMVYEPEYVTEHMQSRLLEEYHEVIPQLPTMHQLYFEGLRDLITEMNRALKYGSELNVHERNAIISDFRERLTKHNEVYAHELNRPQGYYDQRRNLKKLLVNICPTHSSDRGKLANIAFMYDLLISLKPLKAPSAGSTDPALIAHETSKNDARDKAAK